MTYPEGITKESIDQNIYGMTEEELRSEIDRFHERDNFDPREINMLNLAMSIASDVQFEIEMAMKRAKDEGDYSEMDWWRKKLNRMKFILSESKDILKENSLTKC